MQEFNFYDLVLIKQNHPSSEYHNLTAIVLDQSPTYVKVVVRDPNGKDYMAKHPIWVEPSEIRLISTRRDRSITNFTKRFMKLHKSIMNDPDPYVIMKMTFNCLRRIAKIIGPISFQEIDLVQNVIGSTYV